MLIKGSTQCLAHENYVDGTTLKNRARVNIGVTQSEPEADDGVILSKVTSRLCKCSSVFLKPFYRNHLSC